MATQLTLVNNVLRRLREDTVASVADNAYAQLIAMFINDGIQEVTEAYDWHSLRHSIRVDLVDGTATYDLSATVAESGHVYNADRVTNEYSMLRFDPEGRALAFIYDDASDSESNVQLTLVTPDEILGRIRLDDENAVDPHIMSLSHATDGDGYNITLWPTPDASRLLRLSFWTPQADLAIDGSDDNTEVIVPNKPVEAYANMIAANERGEEIGEPGNLLERRWQRTLGAAIESAMSHDGRANRYESWRD